MTTGIIIGILAGLILGGLIMYLSLPKLLFKETGSSLGFDATVTKVEEAIEAKGWTSPGERRENRFKHDALSHLCI